MFNLARGHVSLELNTEGDPYPRLLEDLRVQLRAAKGVAVREVTTPAPAGKLGVPHEVVQFIIDNKEIAYPIIAKILLDIWGAAWNRWGPKGPIQGRTPQDRTKRKAGTKKPRNLAATKATPAAVLRVAKAELPLPATPREQERFLKQLEQPPSDQVT